MRARKKKIFLYFICDIWSCFLWKIATFNASVEVFVRKNRMFACQPFTYCVRSTTLSPWILSTNEEVHHHTCGSFLEALLPGKCIWINQLKCWHNTFIFLDHTHLQRIASIHIMVNMIIVINYYVTILNTNAFCFYFINFLIFAFNRALIQLN